MEDYIIRATAAQGQIRAFAASTREMAERARQLHNTSPVATAALGRLMTGAAMMGVMMKGDKDLLTLQIRGDGPIGGIVATADSKGNCKGYVYEPTVLIHANDKGKLDVAGAVGRGELCIIRDTGLKEPYVGRINLVSGEIAEDLTYYYAVSEQIPTAVALGVLLDKANYVRQAGGLIVQLMPGASEELVDLLEKKIGEITSVTALMEQGLGPRELLERVLGEMELEIQETIPARFYCNCSRERVEKVLVSVGEKELVSMIEDGKEIEVNCHFCGKAYTFSVEELKNILQKAR